MFTETQPLRLSTRPTSYTSTPQDSESDESVRIEEELAALITSKESKEYKRLPQLVECPYCCRVVETVIEYRSGTATCTVSTLLCLVGSCCCCCLVPMFTSILKDAYHKCSMCGRLLGVATPWDY
jgi:hypothetical protein